MKEHDVRQRIESILKMPTAAASILLAGLVGMACSGSGLKSKAHDAGTASGGRAGSTTSSVTTGGLGGVGGDIGASAAGRPNGDSGTAGSSGAGGAGRAVDQGGMCASLPGPCNSGDQSVAAKTQDFSIPACPEGRECYTLQMGCGWNLCMVPDGVHCNELTCNSGDTPATGVDGECEVLPFCYTKILCSHSILCKPSASQYAGICRDPSSDGGSLEPLDASADGDDAGIMHCCGDGLVERVYGEDCDFGNLNGVPLDTSSSPWTANPKGIVWCDSHCRNPHPLCVPTSKLGGMSCD